MLIGGCFCGRASQESPYGDNICVNGTFDTDDDWTKGVGWTIADGVANSSGVQGGNSNLYQTILTVGVTYHIEYTISNYAGELGGAIRIYCGAGTVGIENSEDGTFSGDLECAGNTILYIQASSTFAGDVDNVSVREVL